MIGQINKQTTEITTLYMYIDTIQYTYSACIDANKQTDKQRLQLYICI